MPGLPAEEDVDSWVDRLKDSVEGLTKGSSAKQLAVGGASGLVSGYASCKVGRWAAVSLGGTLLVLQYCHYKGYIKWNGKKLSSDVRRVRRRLEKELSLTSDGGVASSDIVEFCKENRYLVGGFIGGFLIGIGTA